MHGGGWGGEKGLEILPRMVVRGHLSIWTVYGMGTLPADGRIQGNSTQV